MHAIGLHHYVSLVNAFLHIRRRNIYKNTANELGIYDRERESKPGFMPQLREEGEEEREDRTRRQERKERTKGKRLLNGRRLDGMSNSVLSIRLVNANPNGSSF